MKDILFVCHANVGRSQMAEGFYNFFTRSDFAASAGIIDVRHKFAGQPPAEAVTVMQERGINISQQQIKLLTPELCQQARKVVVLCDRALCPPYVLKLRRVIFRPVQESNQDVITSARLVRNQVEEIVFGLLS